MMDNRFIFDGPTQCWVVCERCVGTKRWLDNGVYVSTQWEQDYQTQISLSGSEPLYAWSGSLG